MVLRGLSPARRNVALAAIALLVLWFLWSVRSALNPLGVGLLFAYMLHPLVTSLERRGWSRRLAVNVIFAVTAVGGIVLSLAMTVQARSLWRDLAQPEGAQRHVTGQEVLEGMRAHASALFGPLAAAVWRSWGVRETLDWGRIVFLLVENGMLNRQESDTIEDFGAGFDFDETFVRQYRVPLPDPAGPLEEA